MNDRILVIISLVLLALAIIFVAPSFHWWGALPFSKGFIWAIVGFIIWQCMAGGCCSRRRCHRPSKMAEADA